MTTRNQLKQWFKRGLKPLESQFSEWIDSYWHKQDDQIPVTCIEGIQEALDAKSNQQYVESENADIRQAIAASIDALNAGDAATLQSALAAIVSHNDANNSHQDIRELIAALNTLVAALNGSFIFRGNIDASTDEIAASHGLLTDRIMALYSRTPALGDTLKDNNHVEWYCTGESDGNGGYVWNEYGTSEINLATQTIAGMMIGGGDLDINSGVATLKNLAVTTAKIADGAVTDAKLGTRTLTWQYSVDVYTGTLTELLNSITARIQNNANTFDLDIQDLNGRLNGMQADMIDYIQSPNESTMLAQSTADPTNIYYTAE